MSRLSFDLYALELAETASRRSEDVFRKVGAVGLTNDKRVVAVAYNGLPSGFYMDQALSESRDARRPYMIHAETNLCSLFKRGEVETVGITCSPCSTCFLNLLSHGVKRVIYNGEYTDNDVFKLAEYYKECITLKGYV